MSNKNVTKTTCLVHPRGHHTLLMSLSHAASIAMMTSLGNVRCGPDTWVLLPLNKAPIYY